ncbi:tRNA lysidine(34) synthetase TilS [Acetivibrio saccincola]|uniref:tRNA(Ile)-lysidine synthase n=1 Tax=Acetivibrio saccincola TaxID=1677857 RepID=A0A2K9E1J1_9FIRM|nr:tRNA lysidine(34) synthetase TilS [Acetivibrio saccincola]AUG56238.1 tRNA(Ile)-lysidine synthase [Acetivibrio saccincola]
MIENNINENGMINDAIVEKVLKDIKDKNLIERGDTVVVGLSGGPDSVCLLHVLKSIEKIMNIKIKAVHVNHMLRGQDSFDDEEYVKILCKKLNVDLRTEQINLADIAKKKKLSIEEAGREERYRIFEKAAKEFNGDKIAVAHNKNDQAETVLMNIIRGTGLSGLRGMDFKRGKIIRPLLGIDRLEIEGYCNKYKLKPRIDRTNLESIYTRNKIRLDLIPYINESFSTDIVSKLVKMSEIIKNENDFIEYYTDKLYNKALVKRSEGEVELNTEIFNNYHKGVKGRILRKAIKEVTGFIRGIESIHIDDAIGLALDGRVGAVIHLPHKIRVEKSYRTLKVYQFKGFPQVNLYNVKLNIPGDTLVQEDKFILRASIINGLNTADYKKNQKTSKVQYFDYDKLKGGINIRKREGGDIIKPVNSNGTKKLKKYFIDEKIPIDIRNHIPLVAKGKEIVWIIGYVISDKFKITKDTQKILKLEFIKLET